MANKKKPLTSKELRKIVEAQAKLLLGLQAMFEDRAVELAKRTDKVQELKIKLGEVYVENARVVEQTNKALGLLNAYEGQTIGQMFGRAFMALGAAVARRAKKLVGRG